MRLRPYKSCDAEKIAAWITDEESFLKWGGDHFGKYPINGEIIDKKYRIDNGDCVEKDNFYPWTAFDDQDRVVGHFIMRYLNGNRKKVRFGWVIVDPSIRGKGIGTQMLRLGLQYAFEILGASTVTLGVFENNGIAHACYKKIGFADIETVDGEPWSITEMAIGEDGYRRSREER